MELVVELKLEKCLDTLAGGFLIKGVSGGEKKRTSIAFELMSDPQVLFLDEPTSGLDSLTSFIIVSYLKRICRKHNKTVVMTIHQPNSETFELFDDLTVLLKGKLIYQDTSSGIKDYF
jgi:ABC-type multidrug transport system ATPase subunit